MERERELAVRERLRRWETRRHELLTSLFPGESAASVHEELLTASVEIEDLRNELEFLQSDSSDSGEPEAFKGAPVKPRPHLRSGAVTLPEPDTFEA